MLEYEVLTARRAGVKNARSKPPKKGGGPPGLFNKTDRAYSQRLIARNHKKVVSVLYAPTSLQLLFI